MAVSSFAVLGKGPRGDRGPAGPPGPSGSDGPGVVPYSSMTASHADHLTVISSSASDWSYPVTFGSAAGQRLIPTEGQLLLVSLTATIRLDYYSAGFYMPRAARFQIWEPYVGSVRVDDEMKPTLALALRYHEVPFEYVMPDDGSSHHIPQAGLSLTWAVPALYIDGYSDCDIGTMDLISYMEAPIATYEGDTSEHTLEYTAKAELRVYEFPYKEEE